MINVSNEFIMNTALDYDLSVVTVQDKCLIAESITEMYELLEEHLVNKRNSNN